ncbi:MAG TPA: carboxypeptidase-like regulatory domain-containing protein, partial [Acidobacteriaceae bacterium]|nr:carboxypeptidase-like regulatory domain-containing protein [Acidobacteriaceae bacterium]
MNCKFAKACSVFALALFLTPFAAHSQAVYGSIYGAVTDASGAAIPNASVVVSDVEKGTSITLKSNDSGEFSADHLVPDTYNVKVDAQGFTTYQQNGIRVFADTSIKVAASLTVGSQGQTVEVNADAVPQLKTDRADVATVFDSQQIVDLPIPDRNFTNLQLLLPGAQQLGWSHAASEDPQGSKQIEVDGQAFAGVAYELDGTDNQDPILGIIVINPNADSLSETKITTQNFDAEFGKAVASVVTAQTKSGTNSFHGSLFDYRESNANLARDPFTQGPSQITAINPFPGGLKNQFGGSLGGPIMKDRMFFFADYQGVRQKVGISNLQTVPTAHVVSSCLSGTGCDFSEYLKLPIDPTTGVSIGTIYQNYPAGSPLAGQNGKPYPGNIIPNSQLSAQALAFLKLLQPYAPNFNGGTYPGLSQNYAGGGTGGFNSNQWDVRGDWTASARTHVFGRFSRFTDVLTGKTMFGPAGGAGFGLGGYGGTSKGANDSLALGADMAVTPKLAADVRLGYYRYNIGTAKYDAGVDLATTLGIPGMNTADPST